MNRTWLALLLLSSCSLPLCDYNVSTDGVPVVSSISEAWHITADMPYMPDGEDDYCRTPAETYRIGGGDCEDIAVLFVAMVRPLHPDSRMVSITTARGTGHAIVRVNARYLEPQVYGEYLDPSTLVIRHEYTVEEALMYVKSIE